MKPVLSRLIGSLGDQVLARASVIAWGSPIPAFGDLARSRVATLGLNPSDREFLTSEGEELAGSARRFHTLRSLGIEDWSDADDSQLQLIVDSCRDYFHRNPYDGWFRRLDWIIGGTGYSYYDPVRPACHLDLVPYATARKWTGVRPAHWHALVRRVGGVLGELLRDSPVQVLVLNGASVVRGLESLASIRLKRIPVTSWNLRRRGVSDVRGYAFVARLRRIADVDLRTEVLVLGYNHNIQSSFGVTTEVQNSIRRWVAGNAGKAI